MKQIETTLLLLIKDSEILLAFKKRGFGSGKYNGVGGKIEKNETIEEAMIRECFEEIKVIPLEYEKYGEIDFLEIINYEQVRLKFHLFVSTKWKGKPTETDEMKPFWFDMKNIPYENMFECDSYWLPSVLSGKKIKAFFEFDEDFNIIEYEIDEEIKFSR